MSEEDKLIKEAKKLPWEERLGHKNWKVRNDGCIDLASLCDGIADPKDPRLRDLGSLFKKAVADSNAAVQEKALDALIAYLRATDANASSRYAKEICDSVAAKCLTGRPKTVEKAQTAFLLWVELEGSEVFLDTMEKAVKNKVAKAVVPAIDVMYQALSEFGTRVLPPKRILRMLPELFDHSDQNVRASAKGLTIELCRWIGKDAVKTILFEKMRDTMRKDIEGEMDNVIGVSKPSRRIRSEQSRELEHEAAVVTAGPDQLDEPVDASQPLDGYDLVDPVDILTPLGKTSFWEGIKATKWSERRDAVAELTKLSSAKRHAAGDYSEVARVLKKLITDVNIAVAVEAIQATGNLAAGLRTDFGVYAKTLLPVLLEKLKEKKQTVIDALMQTLQTLHTSGCILLADAAEDVKVATKNKVPSVRASCLSWVTYCIENGPRASAMKVHKEYIPILIESVNDGAPEVRDAAFAALAAFAKQLGMKPLERSLEKLDDVRKKKLTEMIPAAPAVVASAAPRLAAVNGSLENCEPVRKSAASLLFGKKNANGKSEVHRSTENPSYNKNAEAGECIECTDGSKDLFEWITKQMIKYNDLLDLDQLLRPTSVGLQDKSLEVRQAAEACLVQLLRACGFEAINKAAMELHSSGLAAVHPILERQRTCAELFEDQTAISRQANGGGSRTRSTATKLPSYGRSSRRK